MINISARMITAGTALLGILALTLDARAQMQACAQGTPPVTGPDVIVGTLTGPTDYTASGGIDALSIGTTSCNIGDVDLKWFENTNEHPVIGGALYRLKTVNGAARMEQVGQSWLKHGFFALSQILCCPTCNGTDGTYLGVGCSDPYSSARNGTQGGLGPKAQVDAHTGAYDYPPANPSFSGGVARRLQVATTDLEVTGPGAARYFGEGMYVTADDAKALNQNNNASYREIFVSGGPTNFGFTFNSGVPTVRMKSGIQAWKAVDPTVNETEIQIPAEGKLILSSKVTDLGGGLFHYEYALYNMNSDLCVGSFEVPVDDSVVRSNQGFHDVDYRNGDGNAGSFSGTDWTRIEGGGVINWATTAYVAVPPSNANALRWGTTYNFRFDAMAAPVSGMVTLGLWKNGMPMQVATDVPGLPEAPGDGYCYGDSVVPPVMTDCPCGNFGDVGHGCANSQVAAGARMTLQGTMVPNTLVLTCDGVPNNTLCTFMRGTASIDTGVVFGDGLRCVDGTIFRFGQQNAGQDGNDFQTVAAPVATVLPGNTRYYQVHYRNPVPGFCTRELFNASNGWVIPW